MKKILLVACLATALTGCLTAKKEVVVIEKEDVPVPMQYEGKDGYWISKSRMMMLFEIAERYQQVINNKNNQK